MNASAPSSAIRFEPLPDSAYFFAVSPQRACLAQWKSWFLMSALLTPFYCVFAAATNQMWFVLIALTLPLEAMICQWILSSFQVLCVSSEGLELRCLGRVKRSMGWDEIVRVHRVTGDSSTLLLLNDTDLFSRWWHTLAFSIPRPGQKIMAISPAALRNSEEFTTAVRLLAPEGNPLRRYLDESRP
jgi:hypothetical protein